MIIMILKTTLKKLRVRKHITQKELAEMCGISQGTIGDIERGANASTVITLSKIAEALKLTKEEETELFLSTLQKDLQKYIIKNLKIQI